MIANEVKAGILGIDPGEKRIGLAIAYKGISVATAYGVMKFTGKQKFIEKLKPVIDEEDIGLIIMGLPKNMNGSEGESAKKARRLAEFINKSLRIPVEFVDERLTTDQARKMLQETGAKTGRDEGALDMLSAASILQTYLDSKERQDR
jgi:putative Holliday junction resolvase